MGALDAQCWMLRALLARHPFVRLSCFRSFRIRNAAALRVLSCGYSSPSPAVKSESESEAPAAFEPWRTARLNDEQERAVTTKDKCVRVVAGPGSGKTLVLTHRIVYEITNNSVDPRRILCITFTNKAAQEIQDRLVHLVGEEAAKKLTVSTFHSFCAKVLRQVLPKEKPDSGLSQNFAIYDEEDCAKILKDIYVKVIQGYISETKIDGPGKDMLNLVIGEESATIVDDQGIKTKISPRDLKRGMHLVKLAKTCELEAFIARKRNIDVPKPPASVTNDVRQLLKLYEERLRDNNAVDFDDLVYITVRHLHQDPSVRKFFEQRFPCVLVDEFQDTDKAQYELIRLLCFNNRNLFVVGDVDQAIYGWRGAESTNMQYCLSNDFPCITNFQLKKNYRSSQSILSVASKLIANSRNNRRVGELDALTLIPVKPWTTPVNVCWLRGPSEECDYVVGEILRNKKDAWSDCAVLYRTHRQSFLVEAALIKAGIPYKLVGSTPLFSRKVVKDLLGYLHFILNSDDGLALGRIINTPPRGIGKKTLSRLEEWAEKQDLTFSKALLKLQDVDVTEELQLKGRSKTALLGFCELIQSLIKMSETESVGEVVRAIIEKTSFVKFVENQAEDERTLEKNLGYVQQFQETASLAECKYGTGRTALSMFLQDVMLIADATAANKEASQSVNLLTLHASKGMEFKCVFIIGINNGTIPHDRSDTEEERRLFYVGITRAQEQLYLIHTQGYGDCRFGYGSDSDDEGSMNGREHEISDFLKEIIRDQQVRFYPEGSQALYEKLGLLN